MTRRYSAVAIAAVLSLCASGARAFDLGHRSWDRTLKAYVRGGRVDYKALKASPRDLDDYLGEIASLKESEYASWSRDEKVAFWINVYNSLTLKAVIDHYPIQASWVGSLRFPRNSIRQIPGVWDKLRFKVMEREVTLDEIEHGILRKEFREPRVHMALVCASVGCPPLRGEAFTGARLFAQLDDQAKRFLEDTRKFHIDKSGRLISGIPGPGTVYLSPIFKWFGDDFKSAYAPVKGFGDHSAAEKASLNFIGHYLDDADRSYLETGGYTIEYLDYDWSLNERAGP